MCRNISMMYLRIIAFWFLYFMQIIVNSVSLKDEIDRRVQNGNKTEIEYFPFVGQLYEMKSLVNNRIVLKPLCTVSLLNTDTVITAAHCFCKNKTLDLNNPSSYGVRFGATRMYVSPDANTTSELKKITIHPSYMASKEDCENVTKNYTTMDVALVKLEKPMPFHKYINPIQLSNKTYQVNTKIIHAGFGRNSKNISGILMFGASYIGNIKSNFYESFVICPFFKSFCAKGDSGGPMLVEDVNGMPVVGGVISRGGESRTTYTASDKFYSWANSYGIKYIEPKTIAADTPNQQTFSFLHKYALKNCAKKIYAGNQC